MIETLNNGWMNRIDIGRKKRRKGKDKDKRKVKPKDFEPQNTVRILQRSEQPASGTTRQAPREIRNNRYF